MYSNMSLDIKETMYFILDLFHTQAGRALEKTARDRLQGVTNWKLKDDRVRKKIDKQDYDQKW